MTLTLTECFSCSAATIKSHAALLVGGGGSRQATNPFPQEQRGGGNELQYAVQNTYMYD